MNRKYLNIVHKANIQTAKPFNFSGTMHKPSHFPAPLSCYKDDTLWLTMRYKDTVLGVRLKPIADGSHISISIFSKKQLGRAEIKSVVAEIRYRFAMDLNLNEFTKLARKDLILGPVEKRWRGMRPSCAFSLYELLCITITLQNAQVSRSVKMLGILLQTYGTAVEFDNHKLYAFWPPDKLALAAEEDLRALKVGYRAKSFNRVSIFFVENSDFEVNARSLSKEEAADRLKQIYGVGPATAWYLSFEGLKHLDAFDHVSPWEQKILSRLLFKKELVPQDKILREARKRWGKWRMLAIHYIFEDLFWRRQTEQIDWLEALIRL